MLQARCEHRVLQMFALAHGRGYRDVSVRARVAHECHGASGRGGDPRDYDGLATFEHDRFVQAIIDESGRLTRAFENVDEFH
jgi:hypothetical protein